MKQVEVRLTGTLFTACILLGVIARLMLPPFGFNHDMTSYEIVGGIVAQGGNVYAETERYNYGPIWFLLLGAIRWIASLAAHPDTAFRYGIVFLLTAADLAITSIFNRRFGPGTALLFFLNPISIIITGYHNQFDNVAIAIGLAAILLAERAGPENDRRLWLAALCLLGLSLALKHIFFLLPLWLAFRAGNWRDRLLAAGLPMAIFAASFLPFLAIGWKGILHNVLLYRSFNNGPAFRALPDLLTNHVPASMLFIAALTLVGFLLRKRPLFESVLVYLIALVILSPAMANQYLAIAVPAIAASMNPAYALYTVTGSLLLMSNPDGLGLGLLKYVAGQRISDWFDSRFGYDLPIGLLALGLVWQLASRRQRSADLR